jgi:hypothetical protein
VPLAEGMTGSVEGAVDMAGDWGAVLVVETRMFGEQRKVSGMKLILRMGATT